MTWFSIETEIRLIGALAFLFILYSLWMGQFKSGDLLHGYENPVLALELAQSGEDINQINRADEGKARAFIAGQLRKDYGFIVLYLVLFVLLSQLLARLSAPSAKWIGWVAAAAAVLAAVLDLVENAGMARAIATPIGAADQGLANIIRYFSLAKWAALYLFALFAGLILFSRSGFLSLAGLLLLASATVGLAGVFLNLYRPRFYWTFPVSIYLIGGGVVLIALLFTFLPSRVFDDFPAFPREI